MFFLWRDRQTPDLSIWKDRHPAREEPSLEKIGEDHTVACWRVDEIEEAHPLLEGRQG